MVFVWGADGVWASLVFFHWCFYPRANDVVLIDRCLDISSIRLCGDVCCGPLFSFFFYVTCLYWVEVPLVLHFNILWLLQKKK